MQFDTFSVDNIGSFRRHFSLKGLLEAVDIRIVFENWLDQMLQSGSLNSKVMDLMQQVQNCFYEWLRLQNMPIDAAEKAVRQTLDHNTQESYSGNAELRKYLTYWEMEAPSKSRASCCVFGQMLCLVLEIAEHEASKSEIDMIYHFMTAREMLSIHKLKICEKDGCGMGLFYGNTCIEKLAVPKGVLGRENQFVFAVTHPDTGYLGIRADGSLYNGSYFNIPKLKKRAVKACINQGAYAVLLEDGSVVTNLCYTMLPDEPVVNIYLSGERLSWQSLAAIS